MKFFLGGPTPSPWKGIRATLFPFQTDAASSGQRGRLRAGRITLWGTGSGSSGAFIGTYLSVGEEVQVVESSQSQWLRVRLPDGFEEAWVDANSMTNGQALLSGDKQPGVTTPHGMVARQ